jgi:hypothetical protein
MWLGLCPLAVVARSAGGGFFFLVFWLRATSFFLSTIHFSPSNKKGRTIADPAFKKLN